MMSSAGPVVVTAVDSARERPVVGGLSFSPCGGVPSRSGASSAASCGQISASRSATTFGDASMPSASATASIESASASADGRRRSRSRCSARSATAPSPGGTPAPHRLGRLHLEREHAVERLGVVGAAKQRPQRQELVQHDAEREYVDAPIDALAANLLGREIGELALDRAGARLVQLRRRLGDTEVEHLRRPVAAQEQVVRRDVAVHDAERLALVVDGDVRVMQPARGVGDDAHRGAERQLDAGARRLAQELDGRLAAQVLQRDVARVADLARPRASRRGWCGAAAVRGAPRE